MVRRWKIFETGVQRHQAEAHGNEIPASPVADGGGADQNGDSMTYPTSRKQAAFELVQSVTNGLELVVEEYQWIISRKKELIRQLKAGAVLGVEFDRDMAEIRLLDRQLKAFSEQLEASKRRTKKVLEKDEIAVNKQDERTRLR